jgi:pyruvyltransferase
MFRLKYFSMIKIIIKNLIYIIRVNLFKHVPVSWDNTNNFGDALNYDIFKFLFKRKIFFVDYNIKKKSILGIGSILSKANNNSIVFGSGFISENSEIPKSIGQILLLRGPKSHQKLNLNYKLDVIYGDPGILAPLLWKKSHNNKKFELGIILHYVDNNSKIVKNFVKKYQNNIVLINILDNVESIIDQISKCEYVMSSSLHGLICAEAYGIPVIRLIASDKIIGGDFKFDDFRMGIGAPKYSKIYSHELSSVNLQDIKNKCSVFSVIENQKKILDLRNKIKL